MYKSCIRIYISLLAHGKCLWEAVAVRGAGLWVGVWKVSVFLPSATCSPQPSPTQTQQHTRSPTRVLSEPCRRWRRVSPSHRDKGHHLECQSAEQMSWRDDGKNGSRIVSLRHHFEKCKRARTTAELLPGEGKRGRGVLCFGAVTVAVVIAELALMSHLLHKVMSSSFFFSPAGRKQLKDITSVWSIWSSFPLLCSQIIVTDCIRRSINHKSALLLWKYFH